MDIEGALAYLGFGKKGRAWRACGARVYNGGLGAGRGVRGQSPPEAETLFTTECSMETANSSIFFWNFETQKAIKHCWILQFLLENGKKRTFSYKVACKKIFMVVPKGGGHRAVPPP